jgi:hypothetical protein
MLEILYTLEQALPQLLRNDDANWHSVFVDYELPHVERLWLQWSSYRIYLHAIHPCAEGRALYHPHPWSSAMRIFGTYEMIVGYGSGNVPPNIAARLILPSGTAYEMIEPDGWHAVRPLSEITYTVMVTGQPWKRTAPKSSYTLSSLPESRRAEMFQIFREKYPLPML